MREVSAPVLDKGPLPPYCLGFRKPLPGSRVVSRYSCLSVSSFRKRECKQERNRQSERKREEDRRRGGKWDNATAWEELGFHRWTREKQQQQVQLEKETMRLGWLVALLVWIVITKKKAFCSFKGVWPFQDIISNCSVKTASNIISFIPYRSIYRLQKGKFHLVIYCENINSSTIDWKEWYWLLHTGSCLWICLFTHAPICSKQYPGPQLTVTITDSI